MDTNYHPELPSDQIEQQNWWMRTSFSVSTCASVLQMSQPPLMVLNDVASESIAGTPESSATRHKIEYDFATFALRTELAGLFESYNCAD